MRATEAREMQASSASFSWLQPKPARAMRSSCLEIMLRSMNGIKKNATNGYILYLEMQFVLDA